MNLNANITVEVWFSMIELCKSKGAEPPKDLAHLSTEPHLLIKFTQCFNMLILNLWGSDKTVPPVYHFSKWVGTHRLGGSRTWFLALPWHCVSYCKGRTQKFFLLFCPLPKQYYLLLSNQCVENWFIIITNTSVL